MRDRSLRPPHDADAQVMPAPKPVIERVLAGLDPAVLAASSKARGIDALEVLP